MKKLFLSDVDNTLVSKINPKFSKELIKRLQVIEESGDLFVLCSGRPTLSLIHTAENIKKQGVNLKYVAGYNGVEIYDLNKKEYIYQNGLDTDSVNELRTFMDSNSIDYLLYDKEDIYATDTDNMYAKKEKGLINMGMKKLTSDIKMPSPKILVLVNPNDIESIRLRLKAEFSKYQFVQSADFFIEVIKMGVSKAKPLEILCDMENIELSNTYGFGDNMNDYELILKADTGIAVENAKDEIKDIADIIIDSVYDNGVAKYLEYLYEE